MGTFSSVRHHGYSGFWGRRRRRRRGLGIRRTRRGAGLDQLRAAGGVQWTRACSWLVVRGSWFVVSCVHCTSYVRPRAFFFSFFLFFLSFIHSFILFFLRPGRRALLYSPPLSSRVSRLTSPVSECPCPLAGWLARATPPSGRPTDDGTQACCLGRHKTTQREKRHRERSMDHGRDS